MRCWKMRCWDIWRCWGPKIKLKSYEEILALADEDSNEAIAELNSHPKQYFDKFNSEWHMISISETWYELDGTKISYYVDEKYWVTKYR
jgi:hypothetical protein